MTNAKTLHVSIKSAGFRLPWYSLANGSLQTLASNPSDMAHVQFPLPACFAMLLRLQSQAFKVHKSTGSVTFILAVYTCFAKALNYEPHQTTSRFFCHKFSSDEDNGPACSSRESLVCWAAASQWSTQPCSMEGHFVCKKVCIGGCKQLWVP